MKLYGLWRATEDGGLFLSDTNGWVINYPSRFIAQLAAERSGAVAGECEVKEFPSVEEEGR